MVVGGASEGGLGVMRDDCGETVLIRHYLEKRSVKTNEPVVDSEDGLRANLGMAVWEKN